MTLTLSELLADLMTSWCGNCGHRHRTDWETCRYVIPAAGIVVECPCAEHVEITTR